jgi:hypothetical protein
MKQTYSSRLLVLIVVAIMPCSFTELGAQEVGVYGIAGRVITVESTGEVVMVNQGSAVNVISDSVCTLKANRETEQISTRIGTGIIMDVYADSMRVALDKSSDTVIIGNLCELYACIPTAVAESPIGTMAMYDIVFVDFYEEKPLYTLAELVRIPQPEGFDAITQRFLSELYDQSEMGDYGGEKVHSGFYDGMTIPEAFAYTDRYKLERFFGYIAEECRTYQCSNWIFVEVFRSWILAGTP